jgi:hypothetical protein
MPGTTLISTSRHQETPATMELAISVYPHRPLKVGFALPETELRRGP